MATQAEIDTAAAKAKQGGGQAAKDTAAAKAKQNNNNQAAKDTAAAKSKQNGGDGGTSARMSDREAAAGLHLAGNDTISAGRGGVGPTFSDREAAAGLRDTMSGRVAINATNPDFPPVGSSSGNEEFVSVSINAGGGGGGGLAGMEIIWNDQSTTFVSAADMNFDYDGENYWSLVLAVSFGVFTKTLAYDAIEDIFETSGTGLDVVQSKYRFRLITTYIDGGGDSVQTPASAYGQYRETKLCVNGSPRTILIKTT